MLFVKIVTSPDLFYGIQHMAIQNQECKYKIWTWEQTTNVQVNQNKNKILKIGKQIFKKSKNTTTYTMNR